MAKKTLVLLPGLLCDAALWQSQIRGLEDTVDIIVPDLTTHETVQELAAGVLESAPDEFSLCGLSMGGYVALEIMRQGVDRVDRLALLDTSSRPDDADTRRRRKGLIELADKGKFKGVTPRLLPMLVHKDRLEDPDVAGVIFEMAERIGKDGFVRQQKAILSRGDMRGMLPLIDCPVFVGVGRQDELTPLEVSQEMCDLIPDADLYVFEDCGHLPPLERPNETLVQLKNWL